MKTKRGAIEKHIDWKILDAILQFNPNSKMAAEILSTSDGHPSISHDTLERRIKAEKGMTYAEYKDIKMSRMKLNIAKKQYDTAMQGNVTMLIWLGKQYLGQAEKVEQSTEMAINPTNIRIQAVPVSEEKKKLE